MEISIFTNVFSLIHIMVYTCKMNLMGLHLLQQSVAGLEFLKVMPVLMQFFQ